MKTTITRTEMYELAKVGMREKLKATEAQIHAWYREFPELFLGPPQLLRPELRNGAMSNGAHPMITAIPTGHADSKASRVLPYLMEHGPTKVTDLLKALKLKSGGSLSTILKRHLNAGTVERVSMGVYGPTAAALAAAEPVQKKKTTLKKKTKKMKSAGALANQVRQNRARSAELLAALDAASMSADQLHEKGFNVRQYVGPLVRRGYITRTKTGIYKRTGKTFVVDTRKSAAAS